MNYFSNLLKKIIINIIIISLLSTIVVFLYPSILESRSYTVAIPSMFFIAFGIFQILSIFSSKPINKEDISPAELEFRQVLVGLATFALGIMVIVIIISFFVVNNYLPIVIVNASLFILLLGYILKESHLIGELSDEE